MGLGFVGIQYIKLYIHPCNSNILLLTLTFFIYSRNALRIRTLPAVRVLLPCTFLDGEIWYL